VRNNHIGKLIKIIVRLPGGHRVKGNYGKIQKARPVPEDFDYDMWLGPAPATPYTPGRIHWNWRWILDYSGGNLTDWGAHLVDTAQWANNTEHTGPTEIYGQGEFPKEGLYDTATDYYIEYKYANGVALIIESRGCDIRFEGTEGWVQSRGWCGKLEASSPKILNGKIGPGQTHLYTEPAGEHRNFLDCIKSRRDPYFPAETGHRCFSVMHLGNISMILGRKLKWDPQKEIFSDDDEANRMLSRTMRSPWNLI
jgi:predicted dehydrogenase